jgi:hypothetical protein
MLEYNTLSVVSDSQKQSLGADRLFTICPTLLVPGLEYLWGLKGEPLSGDDSFRLHQCAQIPRRVLVF